MLMAPPNLYANRFSRKPVVLPPVGLSPVTLPVPQETLSAVVGQVVCDPSAQVDRFELSKHPMTGGENKAPKAVAEVIKAKTDAATATDAGDLHAQMAEVMDTFSTLEVNHKARPELIPVHEVKAQLDPTLVAKTQGPTALMAEQGGNTVGSDAPFEANPAIVGKIGQAREAATVSRSIRPSEATIATASPKLSMLPVVTDVQMHQRLLAVEARLAELSAFAWDLERQLEEANRTGLQHKHQTETELLELRDHFDAGYYKSFTATTTAAASDAASLTDNLDLLDFATNCGSGTVVEFARQQLVSENAALRKLRQQTFYGAPHDARAGDVCRRLPPQQQQTLDDETALGSAT
eukprot:CAMPEP_0172903866 /NCGR_PEP_ID=MMETSP1075-20121228/171441_1 /TAXON_ID=2916 /ORGANISM="Ceratium fusus, Strain PA161109" /LENGTH=350 /DNA_ID=CAMNT_0013760803 /DNA_START=1 /DNA_END=1050 /DNA_ORIENTATION=+